MPVNILHRERQQLVSAGRTALTAVAFLWIFHALRWLLGLRAVDFGIVPRTLEGLPGILTAPLVHGDWAHLLNNSVPLLSSVFLLVYFYPRIAARAILGMYVLTDLAVWLFARGAGWGADVSISHIGASGVAYALVSFLFWFGIFKRSSESIIVALVILLYFSGMIAGVLPDQINVSWESHLLGGLVGMLVAWRHRGSLVSHVPEPRERVYRREPYLPADTFAYTLREREEIRLEAIEHERQRVLAEAATLETLREQRDREDAERWKRLGL